MPLLLSPPTPQRSSPGLRGSGYELLSVVVDQAPADPRLVVGVRRVTSALDVDVDVDVVVLVEVAVLVLVDVTVLDSVVVTLVV